MLAALDHKLPWYISRSAGLVSWAIITASIVWGFALSSKLVRKRGAPAWLLDLHRYLGALSIVFTVVHMVSLLFDDFAKFTAGEILLPFASKARGGFQPEPVAWGIVGLYILVAVQLTSWVKKYLPRRLWHGIHLLSIPLWFIGTIHGFKAGTEKNNILVVWAAIVGGLFFFFLFLFRMFSLRAENDDHNAPDALGHVQASEDESGRVVRGATPAKSTPEKKPTPSKADRSAALAAAKQAALQSKAAPVVPAVPGGSPSLSAPTLEPNVEARTIASSTLPASEWSAPEPVPASSQASADFMAP